MDLRFDKCNHWPDRDNNFSRSRCKMEGCNLITHVLCTKCKVHLCFTTNRNCFVPYHWAIVATPQPDKEARSNTKNKESVKPAPSQINQNGKTKTKTNRPFMLENNTIIGIGIQAVPVVQLNSGIVNRRKRKLSKRQRRKYIFSDFLIWSNENVRKWSKKHEKSKKCGKVKS